MYEILRRNLLALGAAFGLVCFAAPTVAMSPQEMLAASDAIRNPAGSFSVRLLLSEYRQSRLSSSSTLLVYARPAEEGGEYRNLVRFLAPARDAGKLMLRNGQDLWFYDPASRASVRISPQQRLLGQASNGDVMTTRLARDYRVVSSAGEEVRDGDGATRKTFRLGLAAQRGDVSYARVDYWIEEGSWRPVMARYYTVDNRLLKTAWFRRFQTVLGAQRPTETVIVDGLDPQWVTVMQMSAYTERSIPEQWLQRDYLPRFGGE
ncbi:MAG: outer membrane lipoprotein-sorting protein [Sulfuritalea sp.]|nr:outer membrane lipoprotein-sorting protein [Sulfuritalea sp.]MDP1983919.1 outer membrane lipoprotein-sorting protein [Sulfuritalea sp.]